MVNITNGQKTLAKTASIVGIVQSVAWFIMSLICIVEYTIDTPPETGNSSSTIENFNYRLYYLYLDKHADPEHSIVKPTAFLAFTIIYVVLTTIWFVVSCFQFMVLRNKGVNVPISFKDWAIITWIVSLEDLIMEILVAYDYDESCLPYYHDPLNKLVTEDACVDTLMPLIVIIARGFVLWVLNVVLAFMLYKNARILRKQETSTYKGTFGGIIPIYNYQTTSTIPRVIVHSTPSLYSQQIDMVNDKNFWNVNLRTAMDKRTPPPSPASPISPVSSGSNHQRFFGN